MNLQKKVWASAAMAALTLIALPAHADKKESVQKIMSLQQNALDEIARNVAEAPARQLAAGARQVLIQAVPEDKRDGAAKDIDAEIKKYLDASVPMVRAAAGKEADQVVAPMLSDKFSEDELKQLAVMLDSPLLKKYQGLMPEMSKALLQKVIEDVKPQLAPKAQATEAAIRKILDGVVSKSDAGAAPAKPAKTAPKK
jgi:hypothetical protein